MDRIARNKQYLIDLYTGPFPGHAIVYNPPAPRPSKRPDYAVSDRPLSEWVPWYVDCYKNRVVMHDALDDDGVPFVNLCGYTGIFAQAFGCPTHEYEGMHTNPVAKAIVSSAEEADRLEQPRLEDCRGLNRFFELAGLIAREVGPNVPISVPDIQSPFGIAAIIWEKQDMFMAMALQPESVKRLVDKCYRLLDEFLHTFRREFPQANLVHCPYTWAPPELGCWLSEDEVGAFSLEMFEEFCLPSLTALSNSQGGMFIHCCAHARHQYDGFLQVPNLRGLNPSFRQVPPQDCVRMFSGKAVIMMGYTPEEKLNELLDLATPETRYLFNLDAMPLEEVRPLYDRLRERCPRMSSPVS
ncbi:MAG: uroporphyrinogen decarboxylase family protein [Candidatus Sumerlaeia bacterium]